MCHFENGHTVYHTLFSMTYAWRIECWQNYGAIPVEVSLCRLRSRAYRR